MTCGNYTKFKHLETNVIGNTATLIHVRIAYGCWRTTQASSCNRPGRLQTSKYLLSGSGKVCWSLSSTEKLDDPSTITHIQKHFLIIKLFQRNTVARRVKGISRNSAPGSDKKLFPVSGHCLEAPAPLVFPHPEFQLHSSLLQFWWLLTIVRGN